MNETFRSEDPIAGKANRESQRPGSRQGGRIRRRVGRSEDVFECRVRKHDLLDDALRLVRSCIQRAVRGACLTLIAIR